ncbi:MAG: 3-phosphoshikimate 1-carboxyvinyltransferase [Candidatus Rokubacteria bacterium]|nr:3-phosphoshikimate 1-carboxyvinyltransferase [Candidatus Rokubacteria bacterium]MBI3827733.1 3-phosphoshikimate 1-carboxyvinyltransferase [Candidatus Rokubacteria bacterium]
MRLRVRPVRRLAGEASVPGDKSISHRAALFGAIAEGLTEVQGFLEAEDCLRSLTAVEALGAEVTHKGPGHYRIAGVGLDGLREAPDVIDCGNSGTTARLLIGLVAGRPFWTFLTGDASLRSRPMKRVAEPLSRMGATIVGRADGTRLPLAIRGAAALRALTYELPVASAQVKSAVLLAGLSADGPVSVVEPAASRDHTERMLRQFGARLEVAGPTVTIRQGALTAGAVTVPGDISSAAFLLVAGLLVPDARVSVAGVGLNPTRTGILEVLQAMQARLRVVAEPPGEGEPLGTVTVETSALEPASVGGALVPRLIDEVPVLVVAAALARGRSEIRDAGELRVKESDRIAALARELSRMGARLEERPDGLLVEGGARLRGATVQSGGDHRVAMALAVAGLVADGETVIEDADCIATSFPRFAATLNALAGGEAVSAEA